MYVCIYVCMYGAVHEVVPAAGVFIEPCHRPGQLQLTFKMYVCMYVCMDVVYSM